MFKISQMYLTLKMYTYFFIRKQVYKKLEAAAP